MDNLYTMIRNISLSIIFLISFLKIVPGQDWVRYYGSGTSVIGRCVIEYYDKGYIILGIQDYQHGWLIKTDINGNQLWDLIIGNGNYDCNTSNVEQTKDNGLIISGSMTKYDQPYDDPYIIKINSCGIMEWCKILHFANNTDYGKSVKCTSDGGYIVQTFNYTSDPTEKIHLFKFNSLGDLIWQKIYIRDSLAFGDETRSFYASDSDFLISGFCYYPNPGEPGGWIRPYYIQTDTAGNENWTLVFSQHTGFNYVGDAWSTTKDTYGNYYSACQGVSTPDILKFNNDGFEISTVQLIEGTYGGAIRTILMYDDSTLITSAGWTYNGTNEYLALIKSDTMGIINKIKYLPNPDYSGIRCTIKTFDSKIMSIGRDVVGSTSRIVAYKVNSDLEYDSIYTRPFNYDSLCPDSITSKTIDPDCDFAVDVEEPFTNVETIQLKIYPNPAYEAVTVEMPKYLVVKTGNWGLNVSTVYHQWKSTILEVYDLSGTKIHSVEIPQNIKSTEINVSTWPHGLYYFRLVYNKATVSGGKVMIN